MKYIITEQAIYWRKCIKDSSQLTHHVKLTSIWCRYYVNTLLFNAISMCKKSTAFRRILFNVILMCKKLTLDVLFSTSFCRTENWRYFDLYLWCNINGKLMQLWSGSFGVFLKHGTIIRKKKLERQKIMVTLISFFW